MRAHKDGLQIRIANGFSVPQENAGDGVTGYTHTQKYSCARMEVNIGTLFAAPLLHSCQIGNGVTRTGLAMI